MATLDHTREIAIRYLDILAGAFVPAPPPPPVQVAASEWQPVLVQYHTEDGEWEPDTTAAPFDGRRYLLRTEMGALAGRWVSEPGVTKDNNEYDGRCWLMLDDQCAFDPCGVFGWRQYDPAEWNEE